MPSASTKRTYGERTPAMLEAANWPGQARGERQRATVRRVVGNMGGVSWRSSPFLMWLGVQLDGRA